MPTYVSALWDVLPPPPLTNVLFSDESMDPILSHFRHATARCHPVPSDGSTLKAFAGIPDGVIPEDTATYRELIDRMNGAAYCAPGFARIGEGYRERMREMLRNVLAFFYQPSSTDRLDRYELLLTYSRLLLRHTLPHAVPDAGLGALATFETLTHLNCYVMLKDFDKSFTEHLVHQSLVFYIGLVLLKRFRPQGSGPRADESLLCLVRDVIRDEITGYCDSLNEPSSADLPLDGTFDEPALIDLRDRVLTGDAGCLFVKRVWALTSLLHDYGYYVATIWDFSNYNSSRRSRNSRIIESLDGIGVFERLDGVFRAMSFLENCGDHVHANHLTRTKAMLKDLQTLMERGDFGYYLKSRRHYHPFWGTVELCRRYARSDDLLSNEDRLAFLIAMRAVYAHHFGGAREVTGARIPGLSLEAMERDTEVTFRSSPITFLLMLVDSLQNFSRLKFDRNASGDRSDEPEIKIPLKTLDLQAVVDERNLDSVDV